MPESRIEGSHYWPDSFTHLKVMQNAVHIYAATLCQRRDSAVSMRTPRKGNNCESCPHHLDRLNDTFSPVYQQRYNRTTALRQPNLSDMCPYCFIAKQGPKNNNQNLSILCLNTHSPSPYAWSHPPIPYLPCFGCSRHLCACRSFEEELDAVIIRDGARRVGGSSLFIVQCVACPGTE